VGDFTFAGNLAVIIPGPQVRPSGEKLKPDEEVAVAVAVPGMPINADVKKLPATIDIQKDEEAEKTSLTQGSVVREVGGGQRRTKLTSPCPICRGTFR
jgi:hypothetical protein